MIMGLLFVYSLKVALCLIAFYLAYKLLLSRDSLHLFNHFLLLSIITLSLVIPCIKVATHETTVITESIVQIEEMIVTPSVVGESSSSEVSVWSILFIIYIAGVAFFLLRDVISVIRLCQMIRRGRVIEHPSASIVVVEEKIAPFSWFGYIVINEKDYAENPREILIHELAHTQSHHSLDVALCNLLIVFQWFNPAAWLLKRELQEVHEFAADQTVLETGVDARQYQMLLIKKSVGEQMFSMANNLNHQSLKRRIKMMKSKKSSRWQSLKAVVVVPIAAVAVVAFANPKVKSVTEEVVAETKVAPDNVFTVVQNMPEFPGKTSGLLEYLQKNVKFPQTLEDSDIEGTVAVSFIVRKDGSIDDVKVMRSVHPDLDAEAKRVVEAMPKWNAGTQNGKAVNVRYVLPIKFEKANTISHEEDVVKSKEIIKISAGAGFTKREIEYKVSTENNPLVIINGVKSTSEDLKKLPGEKIKHINVLHKEGAIEKYGDAAKDGAIEVTLK